MAEINLSFAQSYSRKTFRCSQVASEERHELSSVIVSPCVAKMNAQRKKAHMLTHQEIHHAATVLGLICSVT
jgi:hypothetical protein